MSETFRDFRAFETVKAAESNLGVLLKEADIPYEIQVVGRELTALVGTSEALMNVWLQLYPQDFGRVNAMLEQNAYQSVALDKGHFMNSFTDAELREVLDKYDEWSAEEYVMARKIMESRGTQVSDSEIAAAKATRLAEIRKPIKAKPFEVFRGFAIAVLFFPFFGSFFAMMIGWNFYNATRTDPVGKRYYVYTRRSRRVGLYILTFSILITLCFVLFLCWPKY